MHFANMHFVAHFKSQLKMQANKEKKFSEKNVTWSQKNHTFFFMQPQKNCANFSNIHSMEECKKMTNFKISIAQKKMQIIKKNANFRNFRLCKKEMQIMQAAPPPCKKPFSRSLQWKLHKYWRCSFFEYFAYNKHILPNMLLLNDPWGAQTQF